MITRRDVLNLAVSAGAAAALLPAVSRAANQAGESPSFRIVDTNVSLFHWPFRRLPLDNTESLVKKYRSLGIGQVWAGSFEGVLHRDIAGVNRRLAEACLNWPELIPIGSVNPELPGWEEDLRQCCGNFSMPGIRLHPNYHGYTLDDSRFAQLLNLATKAGCFVQIAVSMGDTRTQHPNLVVEDVDLAPLPDLMQRVPRARVQILNDKPRGPVFERLAETTDVLFDTARVDGTDGIPKLVRSLPAGRVLFGTHAPSLIPEAALIRIHESGELDEPALRAVYAGNADSAFWKNGL